MFNVIFVVIGTLIGAGFASGSEINLFFNRFGITGFFGIFISMFIILFVMYRILSINLNIKANSYNEFVYKKFNNKYIQLFLKIVIDSFALISFYVMVAGFSSFFSQELNVPKIFGSFIICISSFFIFNKSINAIVKVNTILTPLLLILLLFLGFRCINIDSISPSLTVSGDFFTSSILYASYNIIILIPMLISLNKFINNKKSCIIISTISTAIILFLAILISLILFSCNNVGNFNDIELPIVFIASKINVYYKYIYGALILIAIFTSSIASGYSFLDNFATKHFKYVNFLLCISGIFIGNISFSSLINLLYPIFGFLGIFSLSFLVI